MNKKLRLLILVGVLVLGCAAAAMAAVLSSVNSEPKHTHSFTEWQYDENQHWKVCPEDGERDESTVADHVFIAGECECGASEKKAKYGTVTGKVVLRKLGEYVEDFTDIIVDMGDDDVEITGNAVEDGYEFTVSNVKVGKYYNLTITKQGYLPYSTEILLEKEDEEVRIGGDTGVVLGYEVFGLLVGYDAEYHDFSKVNDEEPCIIFREHPDTKTMNVLTKDSYNEVSASMRIRFNNSTSYMHTQGVVLKFEDGKHIVVRFHNGDLPNGRIQFVNNAWDVCPAENTLLGPVGLDEWGEKALYELTDKETEAIKGDGLDLTVVVKDGKVYSFFNKKCISIFTLPKEYADKKVQVGFFAWDTASNAEFPYRITEDIPKMPTKPDVYFDGSNANYNSTFSFLAGYDAEYHDFSNIDNENPYIVFKENPGGKTFNVLTRAKYNEVSATLKIKLDNSSYYMHTQGIVLLFEDGKHAVVRYHNGDMVNGNIQYCDNAWDVCKSQDTLLRSAGLNQYGEFAVHTLTDEETEAVKGEGVDLTVVVKNGKLYTFFDEKCVAIYSLPDGYDDKKVQVGYFAWDAASNAAFYYKITEDIPEMPTKVYDPTDNSVFTLLEGYDGEYHDFSKVEDANPCIIFKKHTGDKTLNVLTKASYTNVSASMNIKFNNSTYNMHTQGIVLKFEDGKHLIVRYHNGDMVNGNIQYVNSLWSLGSGNSLFGSDAGLNQWGENPVYTLTNEETAAIKAGGLDLNVVVNNGKLYTFFNKKCVAIYELPAGYANKKVQVGYFAFNAASNAVFNYKITKEIPELPSAVYDPNENSVFTLLEGYDREYHDFSKVEDANPCIIFKENAGDKTMNVLTKASYNDVSASMNIKFNNSTFYMHTQGIVLKFEDGKHAIVRYHNGDAANGNIQYVNTLWSSKAEDTLFGADAGLNQWGENPVYTLTDEETAAIKAGGLDLKVVVKGGKLYTFFNEKCVAIYNLPAGYENKKVQIGYFAFNAASNAVFNYAITDDVSAMQSAVTVDVISPEGVDCTVTAAPEKDFYDFGDQIELTFQAPDGYRLDGLTICGEDRYRDVENGKLTITADRVKIEVKATFAKEKPIALNLTIQGKKLGTTENLPEGTVVTFKGTDYSFTVDADGKITAPAVAKGEYTVCVDRYFEKIITFNESLTDVTLEYDTFKEILHWGSFDFSKQNESTPEFGITNDCSAIFTNDTYDEVIASIYLKGTNMNQGNAGILFRFVDEGMNDVVTLRMEGRDKVQFSWHDLWGNTTVASGTDWQDLIFFTGDNARYLEEYDAGTLKLTALRKGATIYVFLDDQYIGQRTFDAKYENAKCEAGFITENLGNASEWKSWKVEVSEKLSSVEIVDETASDAHGRVEIAPADAKLGDTVTITTVPDKGYKISALTVNGADVTRDMNGSEYKMVAFGSITVKAEFEEITVGSIHAEISGKKFGVTGNALTTGMTVTLTANGLDAIPAELIEEDGKLVLNVPELPAAAWTVSIPGYQTKEVIIVKGQEYGEAIVLEYNTFENGVQHWGEFDFSRQNDSPAVIAATNEFETILTNDTYGDVAFSLWLSSADNKDNSNQGIAFRFEGGGYVLLRMEGRTKIQFALPDWYMNGNGADGANWGDLLFFDQGDNARYLTEYEAGTLKLTCVRRGNTFDAYLNDDYIGSQTVDAKYADVAANVGIYWANTANGVRKEWTIEMSDSSTSFAAVTDTFEAAALTESPAEADTADDTEGTVIDLNGKTLVFVTEEGESITLTVEDGKINGVLPAGNYTVNVAIDENGMLDQTELVFTAAAEETEPEETEAEEPEPEESEAEETETEAPEAEETEAEDTEPVETEAEKTEAEETEAEETEPEETEAEETEVEETEPEGTEAEGSEAEETEPEETEPEETEPDENEPVIMETAGRAAIKLQKKQSLHNNEWTRLHSRSAAEQKLKSMTGSNGW